MCSDSLFRVQAVGISSSGRLAAGSYAVSGFRWRGATVAAHPQEQDSSRHLREARVHVLKPGRRARPFPCTGVARCPNGEPRRSWPALIRPSGRAGHLQANCVMRAPDRSFGWLLGSRKAPCAGGVHRGEGSILMRNMDSLRRPESSLGPATPERFPRITGLGRLRDKVVVSCRALAVR